MSILLLEEGEMDGIILRKYPSRPPLKNQPATHQSPQLYPNPPSASNRKTHSFLASHSAASPAALSSTFLLPDPLAKYQSALSLRVDRQRGQVRAVLFALSGHQTPLKVANPRWLQQLAMRMNAVSLAMRLELVKVAYSSASGAILLQLPLLYCPWSNNSPALTMELPKVQYIYTTHVKNAMPLLDYMVEAITSQALPRFEMPGKAKHLHNLGKYSQLVNVSSHIAQGAGQRQQSAERERSRKVDILRTMKCRVSVGQEIRKPIQLYQFDPSGPEIDLQLSPEEVGSLAASIATPACPKPKNGLDNTLNVNHIYVHDIFSLSLNRVNEGGFSTIYLSEIKYLCVYPTEGYELFRPSTLELSSCKGMLQKCVIIKVEDEEGGFSRNGHEVEILKRLRNVSSVFLPKYYLPINKPNPLANAVLMDYLPHDNLKHYLRAHFPSLSLFTKLYLLLSTVHAVRLLRDHRVVHLDLKPNNIMLSPTLLVKLIDFGESYHPEVCAKRPSGHLAYHPGFTIPYSSPEVFSNETKFFTSKSDVFSLGVIMFEVLYNCFPFDIFEPTEVIDEVMGSYLSKWLLSPEECEGSGEAVVLKAVNALISKCLSPEASFRPELDWIAVVLRNCLEVLY